MTTVGTKHLQPISGGEVKLPACDGTQTIANDGADLFTGGIDSDFKEWDANEPGTATPKTGVVVHEMIKDGDFTSLFGSLSKDTEELALTQHQILDFVHDHKDLLRDGGHATFLLFKSKGKFFVASAYRSGSGTLRARVHRFDYDYVWLAAYRPRVVVAQLAA